MNKYIIESNFNLKVSDIKLLDKHFGTEIYLINTDTGKYIVKVLPLCMENIKNEGSIAEYLYNNGMNVARFLKSKRGNYVIKTDKSQFTVQKFIEGETISFNTAPDWVMEKSAEFLGRSASLLKDYGKLPLRFGKEFCRSKTARRKIREYKRELVRAKKCNDLETIPIWEEQIRHLKRISKFRIDTEKLTYTNSHGDYHIGQIIVNDQDISVIDWSSACCLPICLDVITSFVFSSPCCTDGIIDADGLKKYIQQFMKWFPLTDYDIKAMPYMFYFWHCMCNYRPDEYTDMAEGYKPLAKLIRNMLNWLYDNVEELSLQLTEHKNEA